MSEIVSDASQGGASAGVASDQSNPADRDHHSDQSDDRSRQDAASGARWVNWLLARVWFVRLVLILVALACFLPGQATLPPTDRDEGRFVQATKQMVATGDYVDIRFQDEPRHKKPAGIHWMQSLAVIGIGDGAQTPIWVYRLPSLIGGVLAVLFAHAAALSLFGPRVAFVAAVLTASTIMIGIEANIAKTDAVLLATILAAQAVLARWWMADQPQKAWTSYAFWAAIGLGFLVKGPIITLVVGLTIAALLIFGRRANWLRPALNPMAILVGISIAAPWYILIYLRSGNAFFEHAIGTDLLGKVTQGQESHGAPPGTYVLAAFGTMWPVVAFVPEAIAWVRKRLRDPAVFFCLCWILPTWIAFEAFTTKLPHYVMPTYPAFAILVAAAFAFGAGFTSAAWRRFVRFPLLLIGPLLLIVAAVAGRMLGGAIPWTAIAIICIGTGITTVLWLRAPRSAVTPVTALSLALATALFFTAALQFVAPTLDRLWLSNSLADRLVAASGCAAPRVVTIGYNEPSFVFLSPGPVVIRRAEQAVASIDRTTCQLLIVDQAFEADVTQSLHAAGVQLGLQDRVQGLNYNGGDELDLALYRVGATQTGQTQEPSPEGQESANE